MQSKRAMHCSVLGVEIDADSDTIRAAYKRLALEWHPDKNSSPDATDRFQQVGSAYDYLSRAEDELSDDDEEFESHFGFDMRDMFAMFMRAEAQLRQAGLRGFYGRNMFGGGFYDSDEDEYDDLDDDDEDTDDDVYSDDPFIYSRRGAPSPPPPEPMSRRERRWRARHGGFDHDTANQPTPHRPYSPAPLRPVTNVRVDTSTKSSVTVVWEYCHLTPTTRFNVECRPRDGQWSEEMLGGNEMSCVIERMSPKEVYEVRVCVCSGLWVTLENVKTMDKGTYMCKEKREAVRAELERELLEEDDKAARKRQKKARKKKEAALRQEKVVEVSENKESEGSCVEEDLDEIVQVHLASEAKKKKRRRKKTAQAAMKKEQKEAAGQKQHVVEAIQYDEGPTTGWLEQEQRDFAEAIRASLKC